MSEARSGFGAGSQVLLVLLAVVFPARAVSLEIMAGYDPNRHNRFLSGFPGNPVPNDNVLGKGSLDFSGLGWSVSNNTMNIAMITSRHFVSANHFKPSGDVQFLSRDGVVRTYTVSKYYTLKYQDGSVSDLTIGELTTDIAESDQVSNYGVVMAGEFKFPLEDTDPSVLDYYTGQQIIAVGKNEGSMGGKIGINTIDSIEVFNFGSESQNTVGMIYDSDPGAYDEARLVGGDSGSPTFLMFGGQLTLLGIHSGIDTSGSIQLNADAFIPYYVDQIDAAIAATGHSVRRFSPVPEPSAFAMIAAAAFALRLFRRLRRVSNASLQ